MNDRCNALLGFSGSLLWCQPIAQGKAFGSFVCGPDRDDGTHHRKPRETLRQLNVAHPSVGRTERPAIGTTRLGKG